MLTWHGGDENPVSAIQAQPTAAARGAERKQHALEGPALHREPQQSESSMRNLEEARWELYPLHAMVALKDWKACMARALPLLPVTLW